MVFIIVAVNNHIAIYKKVKLSKIVKYKEVFAVNHFDPVFGLAIYEAGKKKPTININLKALNTEDIIQIKNILDANIAKNK